jgi:type II secretory pathway pseudopilin PulG
MRSGFKDAGESGLTLIETLLSVLIIVISAVIFLMWQKTSWSRTTTTNRLMVAGHVVQKQIEWRRMAIAQNPLTNFSSFRAMTDTTIVDNSVKPPVTVRWIISDTLHAPNGDHVQNAVRVQLIASWGSGKNDTLKVSTNIAKDF